MLHFFKLIRWKNLVLIIISQLLVKYALLEPFQADTALNTTQFILLIIACVCIAAAGNIINDVYDVVADTINKPERVVINKTISEKAAMNWFIGLNITGIAIGFYLSHSIEKSNFVSVFALTSIILYIYTTNLKGIPVLGNVVISILVGLSILIVGFFDLLPEITEQNKTNQFAFFKIILGYSVFAFILNWLRELVKDIEDTNGDYKAGYKTLPVILGRDRTTRIAFAFALVPLVAIVYYLINHLNKNSTAVIYFLIAVVGPLLYVVIKLFNAKTIQHYKHISLVLKVILFTGILSLLLYPLTLQ